jgi:hypothetical protein
MNDSAGIQQSVQFCFNCGKRIDNTRRTCWYCGASIHRKIRPPEYCRFCRSEIPPGAVKCAKCGEFQDGRSAQTAAPPPQQVVFIVDQNLLGGGGDRRLMLGQPVPMEVARQLTGQTLKAIESGRPEMIDQPGVRALPAPAGAGNAGVLDIEAVAATGASGRKALPGGSRDVAVRGTDANLPSRREDTPQGAAAKTASALGHALGTLGRWLILNAPGRSRPEGDPEADATPRYRKCVECGSEILSMDNFCYHCGHQYHVTMADVKRGKRTGGLPVNTIPYLLVALMIGWLGLGDAAPVAGHMQRIAVAGAAAALSLIAFFRHRSTINQGLALAGILGAAAALLLR